MLVFLCKVGLKHHPVRGTQSHAAQRCVQAVNVTLEYSVRPYTGGTCVEVAGHSLSTGVIIAIVLAGVLALVIVGVLIKCFFFCV